MKRFGFTRNPLFSYGVLPACRMERQGRARAPCSASLISSLRAGAEARPTLHAWVTGRRGGPRLGPGHAAWHAERPVRHSAVRVHV